MEFHPGKSGGGTSWGATLGAGGRGGGLDLILGIGSEELLSGDIPEQYDHGRQEHGWG